jgi:hypothetical protein
MSFDPVDIQWLTYLLFECNTFCIILYPFLARFLSFSAHLVQFQNFPSPALRLYMNQTSNINLETLAARFLFGWSSA